MARHAKMDVDPHLHIVQIEPMTLAEYLEQPGKTATALALATGSAVSTITRAAKGEVMPSRTLLHKIFDATNGSVTPNDFLGIAA